MLEGMVATVHAVPRLLYMRPFKPYFVIGRIEGPDVSKIVRQSVRFERVQREAEQCLTDDFERARDYSQIFEEYRVIHIFGEYWNFDAYAEKQATATVAETFAAFKNDTGQLNRWSRELDRMKLFGTERNLLIDSKTLKNALVPVTTRALDKCRSLLLTVARDRAANSLHEYTTKMRDLTEQPRSLRDFADHCEMVNMIKAEADDLDERAGQVVDMYELLDQLDVKIPASDSVKKDNLKETRENFADKIIEAEEAIQAKMAGFGSNLDNSIHALDEELMSILASLYTGDFVDPEQDPKEVLDKLAGVSETLAQLGEKAEMYKQMQETFKVPQSEFTQLRDTTSYCEAKTEVWQRFDSWNDMHIGWKTEDFKTLDLEAIATETAAYFKDVHKMSKKAAKGGQTDPVVERLKELVEEFKEALPVLQDLGNRSMQERHWKKIFDRLEQPYDPDQPFTMEQLLRYGVLAHADFIGETSATASGEYGLEQLLAKIRTSWADTSFVTINNRDSTDVWILGGVDEIIVNLEDSQVSLQTILASRFVGGIRAEVEEWEKKLGLLSEILDEWLACQRAWMYLENIFSAEDIQKQLPAEATKFIKIDKFFKDRMRKCNESPNVISQIMVPKLLETFVDANNQLDAIQKSLEDYLETKRGAFARFYFLSNDELLEILSQTRDPHAVQPHLMKCFDALKKLTFGDGENAKQMKALNSSEGEVVPFTEPPVAEGAVEHWLLDMQKAMVSTLYTVSKACLEGLTTMDKKDWYFAFPAAPVIMIGCIEWTNGVETALVKLRDGSDPGALTNYNKEWIQSIQGMVELVRTQLTPLQRGILAAKLVIDVHARDTVDTMCSMGISWVNDFEWQRQLRYYWEEEADDCVIRQTNTRFLYGYEYLGNSMRLVITPLTDKCYMTLTGALHLGMGGAPAGPAGTGKTETTKDLAKALARQCVVMNCSDGLDYKMMGRFFSGLAQSGAWACFDEFNRIDIEVLSVIAQQILTIQEACKMKAERFVFEGREIPLNSGYGVFITMNPGYAGRAELPDNLKALFRPVAMMVPDYRLIAEIMLFAEGFGEAKGLSNKMTQLYRLSSEQLSKQDHYDFGMRAVKSVLVMAGQLKRANPDIAEDITLIRALRDSNLPKFLYDDVPLFMAIIQDLFPGVEIPNVDYGRLQTSVETALRKEGLQPVPTYVAKIIQLYETMLVRHGVMVVGLTLTGKSRCQNALADALSQLRRDGEESPHYEVTRQHTLNPKSVTMGELYGEVNPVTQEWTDGLVPTLVRLAVGDDSDNFHWITFDGPVDALWIENMNTVLDDNKMLCLSNGERIKLAPTMHMVFEVNDLAVASPATVSRCGMVFMESVYLGNQPYITSWCEKRLPELLPNMQAEVQALCNKYLEPTLEYVRSNLRAGTETNNANLLMSFFRMLESSLVPEKGIGVKGQADEDKHKLARLWFIFSIIWSIGGNLREESRPKFDEFIRKSGLLIELDPTFPSDGTVFDFCVSAAHSSFVTWTSMVPTFEYVKGVPFFDILVPTGETTCYEYVLGMLIAQGSHVMLVGETGTGKSVLVQGFLNKLVATSEKGINPVLASFSAQTSARNMQDLLESKLDKIRKNLLGAGPGRQCVVMVDDINMPALEKYGAQPPIELVRQTLAQGGFYDLKKLFFKRVQNTAFIAACGPPGGGRNTITPRLVRHFNLLWMPQMSGSAMQNIFGNILSGFLGVDDFTDDVKALARTVVAITIKLYDCMCSEMLPTPSKSHYTFNLRDVSKVTQGILQITSPKCPDADVFLRLWCHEASRVFADRLVNKTDREWFASKMSSILKEDTERDWPAESFPNLMFGAYMKSSDGFENAPYEEVDVETTSTKLDDALADYNMASTKPMNLVFFKDACHHLARISRIITQPRGCALLVGVGGSGRSSLVRLASAMWDYTCFSIEITRTYDTSAFHDDLKRFMFNAGCKNKPCVFLFSDTQIVKESFVEDINNLLNAGEVPNMMGEDDMAQILNEVRPLAKAAGKPEGRDAVYAYFVQLVRQNLHIVLAMSPIGDAFRVRCRMFPSLVNCCTIDWFDEWPRDALLSVAQRYFGKVDFGDEKIKEGIAQIVVDMQSSVSHTGQEFFAELRRKTYTTPTSYLELLNLYSAMLAEQRELVARKISHYSGGINKLVETNVVVDKMKKELVNLQPILQKAAQDTQVLLKQVAEDQANAEEVKVRVKKEEAEVAVISKEAGEIAADAQRDLDEAMPAFHSAVNALKSLNKSDIQEMKAYKQPPELVQMVLEAVCILLGKKPSWDEAKKIMSDMGFLQSLQDFDKDNIDAKKIKAIQKYVKNESFQPDNVGKVSKAAKSLCLWVRAMDTYDRVAKTVEPKKEKLAAAKAKLSEAETMLKEKQQMLADVEARVAGLKRTLEETQSKARELEDQEKDTQIKLERAAKLVGGLGSEKTRWEALCKALEEGQRNLIGNMVVCSGAIAYQGPFTAPYRAKLNQAWVAKVKGLGINCADNPTVGNILGDPVTIREWGIYGLPLDTLSVENAIFVTRSRRWPLMVDPQGQANRWVKNLEKANKLRLVKLTQSDMLRALEQSIRVGIPVLLENVPEELDPALDPVLLKQTYTSQGRTLIRLGDTDVDYDANFRFYITTKLGNPHYLPEVCIKVTIVNFTVTFEGLEDQLLADVAALERPDLTQKKEALVVQIAEGRRTIKELEDKILRMLAESSGNILDDEDLINTLDESKKTSALTEEAVRGAEETSKEIDVAQESYRPVATRGSILYFVVADFTNVDPMYQYSLQYFKLVLTNTVRAAEKVDDLAARLQMLIDAITKTMFVMICRGLFEKHKGLFAFMIAASIERHKKAVTPEEWAFFLKSQSPLEDGAPANPGIGWLDDKSWNALLQIGAEIPALAGLKESVAGDLGAWEAFCNADAPQTEPLPSGWDAKLSPFQRLLVLKAFKPEKVAMGSVEYVAKAMGDDFKEAPPFDLLSTYKDSDARGPIIFVLTSGSDPTQYLLHLAKQQGYRPGENLKLVSLGQGQGPIAEKLVSEGLVAGHWVCLQNCHLAVSWLPRLDRLVENLREDDAVNENFRLWLTTMPTPKFPVPVLQSSLKLTQEPPKGLKANVNRSYVDMNVTEFESCTKPGPFKKLIFGLIFFNAVIQERRKYGAIGWNIPYQWMTSDLVFAQQNLRLMIDEQPETPLEALNTIISDVIYGGRVTDAQDVRLTRAVLATYMSASAIEDPTYSYCPQLDDRFKYSPPIEGDVDSYRAYIATFPIVDRPEIFGLHQNADISFQQKETGEMLDTIISLQPRTGGGGTGQTPDEIVGDVCDDLLARLPSRLDVTQAAEATFAKLEDGSMNPLGIFLSHEIEKFNRLLGAVSTMLKEMQRALKGLVVMSAQLDAAYANFLFQQVPTPWGEGGKGYPSLKPLASWSKDMIARFQFMRDWLTGGPPASFWISAFFFPQGFFTSALQAHARRYKLPIDMLRFAAEVMPYEGLADTPAPPDNGTYIHGMVMEGARFEVTRNAMAESRVGELFAPMNVVWLKPGDLNEARPAGWYDCPFYKTNVRAGTLSTTGHSTNHVCNFLLPSDIEPGHWIRRGAALISMTND